jgi:toxin YoeB
LLIQDIDRNGYEGIGEPEPLKYEFAVWWSRIIDAKNRIVYRDMNIENAI